MGTNNRSIELENQRLEKKVGKTEGNCYGCKDCENEKQYYKCLSGIAFSEKH